MTPLTVSQVTHAIKTCLEGTFPSLWIQGEISNCKQQTSGHLYFSLKDNKAQIAAVMFRAEVSQLKSIPKDGDQVLIHGELNVYPPNGKYQILVRELKQLGLGALLLQLEELKQKLLKKGWFALEHKKPLPKFPKRIGVVTSPTGAVIQDIINILTRRVGGFHLILFPVKVQGEGAAEEIARAIREFNRYNFVDVMIVGRGGGSLEDLWAFNQEIVAEAIFNSQIPIISAVGHETDNCISDYVADIRAPTPSAAAELVITEKAHQLAWLKQIEKRLHHFSKQLIRHYRTQFESIKKHPLLQSPYLILAVWMQKLDGYKEKLEDLILEIIKTKRFFLNLKIKELQAFSPQTTIHHYRQLLKQKKNRLEEIIKMKLNHQRRLFDLSMKHKQLQQSWHRVFVSKRDKFASLSHKLQLVDPKNLLKRGYSILLTEKNQSVITSVRDIEIKERIKILLSDGELTASIEDHHIWPLK